MAKLAIRETSAIVKRLGIAAAIIILCFGAWYLCTQPLVPGGPIAGSGSAAVEEPEAAEVVVKLSIDAPGWTKGSSPFVAHITGETSDGEQMDFYHAVWPDGRGGEVALEEGRYTVTWTSAVNADGSIYRTPEEPADLVIEADGSTEAGGSFEQVPAEDVTQDDIDKILGDLADAVEKGDETLSGDAGKDVVDTATGNAQNAPNVDKDKVEQAGDEASDAVKDEPTKPSTGGSGTGSTGGNTGSASEPSGGTGGNPGGSSSKPSDGSSSGGGSDSQPSKPAHTHDWQPVTEQRWVVDQAAWDEQVKVGSYIQCSCGATFNNVDEWNAHVKPLVIAGEDGHSYSVVPQYETIHHDEVGHYETAIIGYKCSACDATK